MRTAVDTNVFSVLWKATKDAKTAAELLAKARNSGSVVISPVTYAELLAYPALTAASVEELLKGAEVQIDFALDPEIWKDTGLRFSRYCERRRRSGGGAGRRLLADFVVGSHALLQCDRLLTFDVERFRIDYPELLMMLDGE